jgi:hypothetical protein
MSKRLSRQHAQDGKGASEASPGKLPRPSDTKSSPTCPASAPKPADESAGGEKSGTADGAKVENDVTKLHPKLQSLVNKLLKEGSTFEDVVEGVNERGGQRITLHAVKSYFQGNRVLQTQRARRQVEDAEALLESLGKDPKSAEARLARATFMTGYSRVNRNASVVTPNEAARYRMQCENLNLKHQILMMQRERAKQELKYSKARTELIQATGVKMQGDLLKLERELEAHRAGDPIGPEILQRIQQLYGLACQPLLYEETVNAQAEARQSAR